MTVHEFGLRQNSTSGRKMSQEIQIVVSGNEIRFIHQDDLAEAFQAGRAITCRASRVEPAKDGWKADLGPVNGPVLGPFNRRDTALQAEDNWLRKHLTPVPKE